MAGPDDDPQPPPSARDRLTALLDAEVPLNEAFERLLAGAAPVGPPLAPLHAVVPAEAMAGFALTELLQSVQAEYAEIEAALARLRERPDLPSDPDHENALAYVTARELADPGTLAKVLEPLQSRVRFEVLFTAAKGALDRLDVYSLSRRAPAEVVGELRREERLPALEYVVEFLRSLRRAADSFEALSLPRWDIRGYLEHLYLSENWSEMGRLVHELERAVTGYLEKEAAAGSTGERAGTGPPDASS